MTGQLWTSLRQSQKEHECCECIVHEYFLACIRLVQNLVQNFACHRQSYLNELKL